MEIRKGELNALLRGCRKFAEKVKREPTKRRSSWLYEFEDSVEIMLYYNPSEELIRGEVEQPYFRELPFTFVFDIEKNTIIEHKWHPLTLKYKRH